MCYVNINCKQNDKGVWCKDKRVRRSLCGIGARMCIEFEGKECPYVDRYSRPQMPSKGMPLPKSITIKFEISEETWKFIEKLEKAHQETANSKLHFP